MRGASVVAAHIILMLQDIHEFAKRVTDIEAAHPPRFDGWSVFYGNAKLFGFL
jgi:hypothetical protein